MYKFTMLIAALTFAAVSAPALAQSNTPDPAATPGIDKRLENQDKRIQKGKETGQLTEREAALLEKRQDKIQGDLDKAKADGVVTKKERTMMHHELNRSSVGITYQKHDRQHDYNHDGRVDRPHKK